MKVNLQTQLRDSAIATFESLAFMFVAPESETDESEIEKSRAAAVNFRGPFTGRLVVTVQDDLMRTIAANMLGEDDLPSDTQAHDALGELANIICGNILPKIGGYRQVFDISAPEMVDIDQSKGSDPTAHVSVMLDDGRADVDLFVHGGMPS